jgi:hypothetical protein
VPRKPKTPVLITDSVPFLKTDEYLNDPSQKTGLEKTEGETLAEFPHAPEAPDIVANTELGKSDVIEAKAKRFLDLVRKGVPQGEAAQAVGMSLAQIKRSRLKKKIEDLTIAYHLPDEIRKQLVKSGLNRLYMMNLGKKDPASQKIFLDTVKQMAADPDVGLDKSREIGVNINIGELRKQLEEARPDVVIWDDGEENGNGKTEE